MFKFTQRQNFTPFFCNALFFTLRFSTHLPKFNLTSTHHYNHIIQSSNSLWRKPRAKRFLKRLPGVLHKFEKLNDGIFFLQDFAIFCTKGVNRDWDSWKFIYFPVYATALKTWSNFKLKIYLKFIKCFSITNYIT